MPWPAARRVVVVVTVVPPPPAHAYCVETRRMRFTTRWPLRARDATGLRAALRILCILVGALADARTTPGDICAACIAPPPTIAPPQAHAQSFASAIRTDIAFTPFAECCGGLNPEHFPPLPCTEITGRQAG